MNIFEEILWPQFVKIEHVSKLPLTEQVAAYKQYVYDLDIARQNWLNYQNKGPFIIEEPNEETCIQFTADTSLGGTTFNLTITTTSSTTVNVDWGDGSIEEIELGEDGEILEESIEHTYAEEDTAYTVNMCFSNPSVIINLDFIGDEE